MPRQTPDQILLAFPHWESDFAKQILGLEEQTRNCQRKFNEKKTTKALAEWKIFVNACKLYLKKYREQLALRDESTDAEIKLEIEIDTFIDQHETSISAINHKIQNRRQVLFASAAQSEASDDDSNIKQKPQVSSNNRKQSHSTNLTNIIPNSIFGNTNTNSNESKQDPLAEIKALKNQLDHEIQSCWPYPNKDRKQKKSDFLDAVIRAHCDSNTLQTTVENIIDLYQACERRKSLWPEVIKGDWSSRTSTLIHKLTGGKYNKFTEFKL